MTTQPPGRDVSAVGEPHGRETRPGPGWTWCIEIPFAGQWLTANRASRYRYGARDWRHSTMVACQKARLPKGITPVRLHAICWYASPRAPVRDNQNLAPTLKAIVDGLTPTVISTRAGKPHTRGGYGLIPDDSDRHVLSTTWEIVPGTRPRVDLFVTEVADGVS